MATPERLEEATPLKTVVVERIVEDIIPDYRTHPLPWTYSGKVIATDVSHEAFMANYEGMRVEWVEGTVIEMAGVDKRNNRLSQFLIILLNAFLEATNGGELYHDPMLMQLEKVTRAPDLQILLPTSLHKVHLKRVIGAADVVIEIVSAGSQRIDRHEKFGDYETAGVPEYWLFDPIYQESLFFRLNTEGKYERIAPDENGVYHSAIMPQFKLPVALLWQDPLPNVKATLALVDDMLAEDNTPAE
jgi:Uma2 family endonuclease